MFETTPDLFRLDGRISVVTGAGSGLGKSFANALAAFGSEVVCVDRDLSSAMATCEAIRQVGGAALAIESDVTDSKSVDEMVRKTVGDRHRVDVLINNAGIATPPKRTHELELDDWDRLMAINLRGVFLCSRAVIPVMLASGSGSIINISSIQGLRGFYPGFPAATSSYAAAKAAVIGLTKQMAAEYATDRIRINAVASGYHGGTNLGGERKAQATDTVLRSFDNVVERRTPMGRKGHPHELDGLIVYLAGAASSFVTGQVFAHDGGWTAS